MSANASPSSIAIQILLYTTLLITSLGLAYIVWAFSWVRKQEKGSDKMESISAQIAAGARAFLKTEYRYISIFVAVTALLLFVLSFLHYGEAAGNHPLRAFYYIVGAFLSGVAGIFGMVVATKSNVKTAQGARKSLVDAFRISFVGGSTMGVGVVTTALLGLVLLLLGSLYGLFGTLAMGSYQLHVALEMLTGFILGAETIALFARIAGGIYTKAADIGADIVGKIEESLPEDDPRNPATIADNVGDNVGDVAGMGADLFGSYLSTLLAAMVLGRTLLVGSPAVGVVIPIGISALGLLATMGALFFVRLHDEGGSVQMALNKGNWLAIALVAVGSFPLVLALTYPGANEASPFILACRLWVVILIGLTVGLIVSWVTEYFTAMGYRPVSYIVEQSQSGPATNLIAGISVGMMSVAVPMIFFAIAIWLSYALASFYGVALAAVAMMSTTAMQLAIDAFGPIADNAGGIVEMAGLPEEVRKRTDALDAVGNTTAAAGKGFALASATLTSLALLAAFVKVTGVDTINLCDASILAGLLLGGLVPFLFSGLIIKSVGGAALKMVGEVRRQFQARPAILEGKEEPDYGSCIQIATEAALRSMVLPGLLALVAPIVVGISCGAKVLGAFLIGIVVVGTAMGLFQCNAGGAWDNAKKSFESGDERWVKGSEGHKAAIVGDMVGDPFKDTSGPAMNILIKLSIVVALTIADYLAI